jgi:hypothetical protein
MDFEKRLERAIGRGERTRDTKGREQAEKEFSNEELKTLHSKLRLDLSEHIETCLKQLNDHFPGFRFETVVGEEGWGAKVSRDDFSSGRKQRSENQYSRFEMLLRPFSSTKIVELAAKAIIRNKDVFHRTHYQFLSEADVDSFCELIDLWVLEYAEVYAAGA